MNAIWMLRRLRSSYERKENTGNKTVINVLFPVFLSLYFILSFLVMQFAHLLFLDLLE